MTDLVLSYGFRLFWALFLGGMLAGNFRQSWNAENGKKDIFTRQRSDTAVWIDPIGFPIILFIFWTIPVLGVNTRLSSQIEFLTAASADMLLIISIYFTVLLLFLPLLRKYFTARTCAAFWLIPVFLLSQPVMMYYTIPLPPAVYLYIPQVILTALRSIWITGFLLIFSVQIISHVSFIRILRKTSCPVEDPVLLEKWDAVREEMDYSVPVELRYSSAVKTPLSVGMRKKREITYLPERKFTETEAELIFRHELHHLQRKDTHTKFVLRFCNALGWIHPLVWLAVQKAEEDLELSCDEIVLKGAGPDKRIQYARLLLSIAGDSSGFTTCLSASAKTLRYRLKGVASGKAKRLGMGLLFVVMALSSLAAGRIALVTARGSAGEVTGLDLRQVTGVNIQQPENEESLPVTDTEAFSQYLSELKVEKCLTVYEEERDSAKLWLDGDFGESGTGFSLTDDYFTIYDRKDDNVKQQYYVSVPVDWEYIKSLE